MTYVDLAKKILSIIEDHQNVGKNRDKTPFLDKEKAFDAILNVAIANHFLELNPNNGMYKIKKGY
jgi:hypothetical protein